MKTRLLAALLLAAASSTAVFAQIKPEDQIRYRQSAMQVMGRSYYGVLGGMAKEKIPFDKDVALRHANIIANISDLPLTQGAFGPGTDKGATTAADARIWREPDKFKAAFERMAKEARKLPSSVGDLNSLKVAVGELGKACKACHDDFRME